jgi:hypothetical protein
VAPGLAEGVVLTALDPMLTALDPTGGMALLKALDPMLTALDPTAGPVEVGLLSMQDANYQIGAADRSRVTATSSETSKLPTSRTTPKETSPRPAATRSPSDNYGCWASTGSRMSTGSLKHGRLPALDLAEERHLNLCPMASYYVLAVAGPLAREESCPTGSNEERGCPSLSNQGSAEERHLSLCPMASYCVQAAASPLGKDESCPSLSTPGSAEAEERDLNPLATLGRAASAPAPTDDPSLGGVFVLSAEFVHHSSDGFQRFRDVVVTSSAIPRTDTGAASAKLMTEKIRRMM